MAWSKPSISQMNDISSLRSSSKHSANALWQLIFYILDFLTTNFFVLKGAHYAAGYVLASPAGFSFPGMSSWLLGAKLSSAVLGLIAQCKSCRLHCPCLEYSATDHRLVAHCRAFRSCRLHCPGISIPSWPGLKYSALSSKDWLHEKVHNHAAAWSWVRRPGWLVQPAWLALNRLLQLPCTAAENFNSPEDHFNMNLSVHV